MAYKHDDAIIQVAEQKNLIGRENAGQNGAETASANKIGNAALDRTGQRRPDRKFNPPQMRDRQNVSPQQISETLASIRKWYKQPRVKDDDELEQRIEQYFVTCEECGEWPTWEAMCLAIGYDRKTVYGWTSGEINASPRRRDLVKKAKDILASYDAALVSNGKMNPVPYIFRAKNYYGMKDQADIVVTPNNPLGDVQKPESLADKYADAIEIGAETVEK